MTGRVERVIAPFTTEQEARIADIARAEAIRVAVALSERMAQKAAADVVDRVRISEAEVQERLSGRDQARFL